MLIISKKKGNGNLFCVEKQQSHCGSRMRKTAGRRTCRFPMKKPYLHDVFCSRYSDILVEILRQDVGRERNGKIDFFLYGQVLDFVKDVAQVDC